MSLLLLFAGAGTAAPPVVTTYGSSVAIDEKPWVATAIDEKPYDALAFDERPYAASAFEEQG